MKKKIVGLFVCMILTGAFFAVFPDCVSADAQDGDYTYTMSNGAATITGYTGAGGAITIPATVGGYPTAHIGDNAFTACSSLTSVTIGNSVTTIGNNSFHSCNNLTSVTIGSAVRSIGDYAFYFCTSLNSVTLPDSVTAIGDYAFYYCWSLSSVTIGTGLTTIGNSAFYSCTTLTSMTIGSGVTTIGNSAFSCCTSLHSVTIGKSVTTIGSEAFSYCSSLTSLTFLGLVAPTTVGDTWIYETPAEIRGYAYASSNFPAPGGVWNGLMMGTTIGGENKPPLASFSWTPKKPSTNQTIAFDASASKDPDGAIITYEWDWNNNGIFEESHSTPTATHSWTREGTYPVTLQVTDNDGKTSTKTMTVEVSSGANNIPSFEVLFALCAIAVSLLLWKKK